MNPEELINDFHDLKIAVVGDVSLDRYCFYDSKLSEPSRETDIPNTPCVKTVLSPGAAGNVAKNISLLGARVYLISVCGDDGFGMELKKIAWEEYKLPKSCIIEEPDRMTFTYMKLINMETGKEDKGRVDFIEKKPISPETEEKLLDKLKRILHVVDGVVIVDQIETEKPGVVTDKVRNLLIHLSEKYPQRPFIVDSRKRLHLFKNMILKPNLREFIELYGKLFTPIENIGNEMSFAKRYGSRVSKKMNSSLYITLSDEGLLYTNREEMRKIFTKKIIPKDITGAGDALSCGLVLSLAKTHDPILSGKVGNIIASLSVAQEGTGKVTPEEVIDEWETVPDIEVIHPDIEIINPKIEKGKIKFAIFDFDGTVSTLREGWEDVMAPLMIKIITGGKKIKEVDEAVMQFIDKTTGIQTILQMEGLVNMVKEFGIIPYEEIKDALYYKKIYREHLLNIVNERKNKIKQGKVPLEHFLVKDIKKFLKILNDKGIILYLVSGTDKSDVIEEAKFLGIASYFTGGIYGSVDNIEAYSKDKVIKELISQYKLHGHELIVFGDGPVEIENAKKHNGTGVGVASYEKQGESGWNPKKIKRLKDAGADILIPDFSVYESLMKRVLDI